MTPPEHVPVLVDRVVALLTPVLQVPEAVVVDATLGLGGHAEQLLVRCPNAHLVGIDRDPQALLTARRRLESFAGRVTFVHSGYDRVTEVLADLGHRCVQAVLFEQHSLHAAMTEIREHFGHPVVAGVHEGHPTGEGFQPSPSREQRLRITVDAHQMRVRAPNQQLLGMAAQAECGIDHHRFRYLQDGCQKCDHPVHQHRYVLGWCHGRYPASRMQSVIISANPVETTSENTTTAAPSRTSSRTRLPV